MDLIDKIDSKIRRAFSDAAIQYDVLTSLHKEIGRELLKKSIDQPYNAILDIGMGTGWLTGKIKFYFPDANVVGIDFAEGMVKHAKEQDEPFTIVQADARALPFSQDAFDCIMSNLAFQWVDNLTESFRQCYLSLKPGGRLSFTMFGYQTMRELFESLQATSNGKSLSIRRLATHEKVTESLVTAGFKGPAVTYERIKVNFPTLFDLLRWTKSIGANVLSKDVYIGKDWLVRANEYYIKNHKSRFGINSTFEVIWVRAEK